MTELYDLCQYTGPHSNANKNTSRNFPCLYHIALTQTHIYRSLSETTQEVSMPVSQ